MPKDGVWPRRWNIRSRLRVVLNWNELKQGVTGLRRLRSAAVYLALVALVMRALVPVGWMPSPAAPANLALIPCPMMDGMAAAMPGETEPQHPAKHQLPVSHEGSICPFATAAQPIRSLAPQQVEVAPARFAFFGATATVVASAWDHAPRAPPPIA